MREIKVDMFEYKKARAPDELCSGGVGPCIAVGAIYGKRGYMIHVPPSAEEFLIKSMFRDLKREVKDKNKLQIYVAGGEIESRYSRRDIIIPVREAILEGIAQYGFEESIRNVQWCKSGYIQELCLILSEGRAKYEEELIDELS